MELHLVPSFVEQQRQMGCVSGELVGSVLFVDISGFTTLTEAAFRHGGAGAEILAGMLQRVFDPMVEAVSEQGGFIASFAGDAFTAIFAEDSHTTRAQDAAHQICRFFAGHDGFTTSWGTFKFSVKCGIDCGPIEWGIPQAHGRMTWYFRGPAIDGAAACEKRAAGNETVTSVAVQKATYNNRGVAGAGMPQAFPAFLTSDVLHMYVPQTVLNACEHPELRHVASVFMGFEGPQAFANVEALFGALVDTASAWEGTVKEVEFGDKGMTSLVYFGAPVAVEGPELAAVSFTQAFHTSVLPKLTGFSWRTGIDAGLVYVGISGGKARNEWTCIGDAVNTSARLMVAARTGETLVSKTVMRAATRDWEFAPRGELILKGKAATEQVFAPTRRYISGRGLSYRHPMFGRGAEMVELKRWIEPIFVDGTSAPRFVGLLRLLGPAGIGKTRLVAELCARLRTMGRPHHWLYLPCDGMRQVEWNPVRFWLNHFFNINESMPYELRRQAVELRIANTVSDDRVTMTTRREVQRTMPFIAELIGCRWDGSSLNALDDPRLRHDNQIMAVNALVAALAETASLVIQLEDMQWIDSSTAQWLHMMTRNLAHLPIAILGTSRFANDGNTPALSFGSHVPTRDIELRPIADTNFPMKMAEALLSAELDQDTLRMISERAEGNPFFTEQLLLHLSETGQLEQKQTGKLRAKNEFWRLPGSLSALLTTRIDRLSPQLQDVIKHAAILGVYFLLPVLRQLMLRSTNINVNDKLLSEAERQAILMRALTEEAQRIHSGTSGEDLYFFRHALLRNAAYSLQVPSVRARLHGLALEIIETLFVNDLEPFLVEIADHARFAQHPNDPKSAKYALDELRYLQLAASSAKAAYRNSEAARLFERIASVISADPALRAEALIQAGHACRHIGDVEMAQRHYERALARVRESGDHCGEEEALEGLGAVFADQGEMRAARVHFERALELKRVRRDRRGEGKSLWNLAYLAWRQGEAEDARVHWEHALAIAREIGSQIDEGEALGPLGNLHRDQGRLDEARALYTRSLEIHRDTGNQVSVGIVLGNIGIVDQRHGRIAEARQHYTFALTIHREFGNRRFEGRVLCDMGNLALAQEQWAESHEYLDQALVIAQEVENRHDESIALGYLGDLFLAQGMRVEARRHYERAVQLSREIGSRRWEGVFLATLGTLDAIEDQLYAAAIHFEAASKLLTYVNATDYLGALEVQRGHLDLAQFRAAQQGVVAAAAQGSLEAIPGKTPAPEQHLDAATRRLYAARTVVAPVGSVIGQAVRLLQAAIEEQKNRKGMTQ